MRAIKNLLGKMQGFGCCPNCGNSYSWKPTGSLPYEGEPAGFSQSEGGRVVINVGFQRGVLLCIECLEKPTGLDANRIATNLKEYGWERGNIVKVQSAIVKVQASQHA